MLRVLLGDVFALWVLLGVRLNAMLAGNKRRELALETLDLLLDLMDDGVGN
jgi:hypothetical protein